MQRIQMYPPLERNARAAWAWELGAAAGTGPRRVRPCSLMVYNDQCAVQGEGYGVVCRY